jgi:hypothetical protein
MSDELIQLEREVETTLAAWGNAFDVSPPQAVVLRVQAAVRQEVNERWLESHAHPEPSAETLGRVRYAVRRELSASGPALHGVGGNTVAGRVSRGAIARTLSVLAAAAMIGLCVGLIHYAGTLKPDGGAYVQKNTPVDQTALENMVASVEKILEAPAQSSPIGSDLGEIGSELDALETSIAGWSASDSDAYGFDNLEDVADELDRLMTEPVMDSDTLLPLGVSRQGALG